MMKNSASNLSIIQALHTQAKQILPLVTHALVELGYQKVVHQRISQQNDDGEISYQGLSRAAHQRLGQVMIKWQLSADYPQYSTNLAHEIRVLQTLQQALINHNATIAAPVLHSDSFTISNQSHPLQLSFFTMPYYINGSVAYFLKQTLNDQQKHELILQAAQLLAHLHNSGWIHGDIKPSNILMEDDLSLLLTDFALAKQIQHTPLCHISKLNHSAGTPAYLAPECWNGQGATVQSECYAFGVMMYEIVMGKRPFTINAQSHQPLKDWAIQHCQQPMAILPSRYNQYQKIIEKVLAKLMVHRYRSMQEVLEDLQAL